MCGFVRGGLEKLDFNPNSLVPPSFRRLRGVRRPASQLRSVYLFLPLGLGPSPCWSGRCEQTMLCATKLARPVLKAVDFVDDRKLAEDDGGINSSYAGKLAVTCLFSSPIARCQTEESKRRRP